ncbi:tail fiber assembly protein, partial [Xenorhabdus innexi]
EWVFDGQAVRKKVKLPEQHLTEAEAKKKFLIAQASRVIAPRQDAVDLDMATEEEKAALLVWKKYRVLLNRVDCSTAPEIDWPEQPE